MRYLVDTHVFLWMLHEPTRLPRSVREAIVSTENDVFYSAVVSWEITTKREKGKLAFSSSPLRYARERGLSDLPITAEHSEMAAMLPLHHRDPFDRLLIAQALMEGLVLVTHDRALAAYNVPMLRV